MVGALSTNVRYYHCDHEIWDLDGKRYQYVYCIAVYIYWPQPSNGKYKITQIQNLIAILVMEEMYILSSPPSSSNTQIQVQIQK